jgi:hypothetical protein
MSCVTIACLPFLSPVNPTALIPIEQCGVTYSTYACSIGGGGGGGVIISGTGTSCCSSYRCGVGNTLCDANNSANLGGRSHFISGGYSTLVGGECNTVGAGFGGYFPYNFIGGGCCNRATGCCDSGGDYGTGANTIVGGYMNSTDGAYTFIGGGESNVAGYLHSVVVGGCSNYSTGTLSFVGGGFRNLALACLSTATGGTFNTSSSDRAFLGGGGYNIASGNDSVVTGGYFNISSSLCSFVGGGVNNVAICPASVVVGGARNVGCGDCSFIGGGLCNTVAGGYASVVGGKDNIVSGDYSVIVGGEGNTVANCRSFVIGTHLTTNRDCTTFVNNLSIMSIPTSAAGLPAGSVWNNGGVLNIV